VAPLVLVVGDALLDIRVAPSEPMRIGADVPADIQLGPGGQGANLAVRLARRGVSVRLVCALADDAAGALVRRALVADGVELAPLDVDATGSVVVLVDPDGERTMLSRRAAFASALGPELLAARDPDWTVVSGYLLLESGAGDLAGAIAARSRRRMLVGCAVPDALLEEWAAAATTLDPDILVLNADEWDRVGMAPRDGLVVTDAAGAVAHFGGRDITATRPDGPPALDTTGAGDAFAAALLAPLVTVTTWPPGAASLARALAAAAQAAGEVTRVIGAQPQVPGEDSATLSA
jgi:sugar/nucleoside kinase (ribokinase family)